MYDPQINVVGDSAGCHIAVSACRGITLGGSIVDLVDLAGEPAELQLDPSQVDNGDTIYLAVAPLHEKNAYFIDTVDYDGQRMAERRQKYEVTLHPTGEQIPYCLAIARVIIELPVPSAWDPNYIPPCAFLSGHSGLITYAEQDHAETSRARGPLHGTASRHERDTLPVAQRAGNHGGIGPR